MTTTVEETEHLAGVLALLGIVRRRSEDAEVEVVRAHEGQSQTGLSVSIPHVQTGKPLTLQTRHQGERGRH